MTTKIFSSNRSSATMSNAPESRPGVCGILFGRILSSMIWLVVPVCLIVLMTTIVPALDFGSQTDNGPTTSLDQNPVYNITWDRRESRVLIRTRDEVILIDRSSGRSAKLFSDPQRQIVTTALSPDGKEVAVSRIGEVTVSLYDVRSPDAIRQTRSLRTGQPVTSIVYAPDGTRILTAAHEGHDGVCVWNRSNGDLVSRLKTESHIVRRLVYSPRGLRVVGVTNSKQILVWNITSSRPTRIVRLPDASHAVQFVDDDSLLCGDVHGNVYRWQISTDRLIWRRRIPGFILLSGIAVSQDRTTAVFAGASDAELVLIDTRNGRVIGELAGHRQTARLLRFSNDGHTLFSAGSDGTVRSWDWRRRVEKDRVY